MCDSDFFLFEMSEGKPNKTQDQTGELCGLVEDEVYIGLGGQETLKYIQLWKAEPQTCDFFFSSIEKEGFRFDPQGSF